MNKSRGASFQVTVTSAWGRLAAIQGAGRGHGQARALCFQEGEDRDRRLETGQSSHRSQPYPGDECPPGNGGTVSYRFEQGHSSVSDGHGDSPG